LSFAAWHALPPREYPTDRYILSEKNALPGQYTLQTNFKWKWWADPEMTLVFHQKIGRRAAIAGKA
jgi:hypothetical protein